MGCVKEQVYCGEDDDSNAASLWPTCPWYSRPHHRFGTAWTRLLETDFVAGSVAFVGVTSRKGCSVFHCGINCVFIVYRKAATAPHRRLQRIAVQLPQHRVVVVAGVVTANPSQIASSTGAVVAVVRNRRWQRRCR